MVDPYQDREQTKAKHFILRGYLQALAFKVLRFSDLTYVDGFSGPWKTNTEDFADSSFMIAITALKDAQQRIFEETGKRPRVRCFFSEIDLTAYAKLKEAVARYHQPNERFEVKTFCGRFEDAVGEIEDFIDGAFALIFIDPTGWTGYPFAKIRPLFARRLCEVLINFMYSFISRFVETGDRDIVASLDPILGGPGWTERLDKSLPRAGAVEKLFRDTLKATGGFEFVVSTKIDKPTEDRPHFFLAYATKSYDGLKAFREIEFKAQRTHAADRAVAKGRKRESKSGSDDLFLTHETELKEAAVYDDVERHKRGAKEDILRMLEHLGPLSFSRIAGRLMQTYMLRETNVKDVVVDLARDGQIQDSWGGAKRKPRAADIIALAKDASPRSSQS